MKMTYSKNQVLMGVLIFALGLGSGSLLFRSGNNSVVDDFENSQVIREETSYKYTSPLLLCGISETTPSTAYSSLQEKVTSVIEQYSKNGATASVYYRNLESGEWFGINEDEKYSPASLLKLPLAMAYYKYGESDETIFTKTTNYGGGNDLNAAENFPPVHAIQVGETYSVDDLLNYMLVYSDNNAWSLLDQLMPKDFKKEIYTDLGLTFPNFEAAPDADLLSVKSYAHFFRVLYNGTYLGGALSEKLLVTMTTAHFEQGILAGIPSGIDLAEKFGERKIVDTEGNASKYELHDCGIVYYPNRPYLLCVMTEGTESFESLSSLIKDISSTVYKNNSAQ